MLGIKQIKAGGSSDCVVSCGNACGFLKLTRGIGKTRIYMSVDGNSTEIY